MKIAFVNQPWSNFDPPVESADSIAILIYDMALRLARSDDVTVYSRKNRGQAAVENCEGITCRRFSTTMDLLLKPMVLLDRLRLTNLRRPFISWPLYHFWYARSIAKDIRKNNYDVIHLFTFSHFVSIIRHYNPDVKIVLQMGDHSLTQRDRNIVSKRLAKTDLIIGCSDFISENIRKRFPEIRDRCHTVYNGVDVGRFGLNSERRSARPNGAKRLVFVGRLSPEKGLHVLLRAFEKVSKAFPDAELEIAGPFIVVNKLFIDPLDEDVNLADLDKYYRDRKSYHEFIRQIVPSEGPGSVSFLGSVSHSELVNNYHRADIFVIPSLWNEPFGIPLVEAMATGLPVIATNGGAFPEIVEEGRTGYLVERGDADSLADSILSLMRDEQLCHSMGEFGRKRAVELFSWEPIIERLRTLYEHGNNRTT